MLNNITWTYAIDLDKDADFSGTGEDISAFVISAAWELGFSKPFDTIAKAAELTLVLRNNDKEFSPEYSSASRYGNFTKGRVIKVTSNYSATDRTHFVGWIEEINPDPGPNRLTTEIIARGYLSRIQTAEVSISVQENITADQAITTILANTLIYPPGFSGRWLLGQVGFSELGNNTILGTVTDYLNADTGIGSLMYVGDNWGNDANVYQALQEVTGREFGRLFVDRNGVINFFNRNHLILNTTVSYTFNDDMIELGYKYGDDVINDVTVKARYRLEGGSPSVLGTYDGAFKILPNGTKTIRFRYEGQSEGARIAGKDAVTPSGGTDFNANTMEDGTGGDKTARVTAAIDSEGATEAVITYTSTDPGEVWVMAGAQVRGTLITDFGVLDAVAQDDTSISDYGRQKYTHPAEMDNLNDAQLLANYIVDLRKDPRGNITSMTLDLQYSTNAAAQGLARTIGDRIKISETQTGTTTKEYFIISERFKNARGVSRVTWGLEAADPSSYWLLGTTGYSELENTTYIGPM